MSDDISVYGACQYEGNIHEIESVLREWLLNHLLIAPTEGEFTLDGEYRNCSTGPNGFLEEDYLAASLVEVAKTVKIKTGEFRCCGPCWDDAFDIIFAGGTFLAVPLELQPTLEALDDPGVRDHYGLDYCVSQP